jgi:hypothetical protein
MLLFSESGNSDRLATTSVLSPDSTCKSCRRFGIGEPDRSVVVLRQAARATLSARVFELAGRDEA